MLFQYKYKVCIHQYECVGIEIPPLQKNRYLETRVF